MEKIYKKIFKDLLSHADRLENYVDSLYSGNEYCEEYLNEIFDVLNKKGLIQCTFADDRAWVHSITFQGKHYFENEELSLPRLLELIDMTEDIEREFHKVGGNGMIEVDAIYDKQRFQDWIQELQYEFQQLVKTTNDVFIQDTLKLVSEEFEGWGDRNKFSNIKSKLKVIRRNGAKYYSKYNKKEERLNKIGNDVFIVHGHDEVAKELAARTVQKLGYNPIILHEQASGGRTIIEKLEEYTDNVAFAIVLYTECDLGRDKVVDQSNERYRARQNVVFEHGLLIGKLKRVHVMALVKGDVETPGDISGVVYVPMDDVGAWKMHLVRDMRAAGLNVSADKLI